MVAILGSGIISWPNQDGCIVKESILVPHHVQVQTSWASLVQAFGLQLTQHITNDACLVYGPPVKKLCLKWCKSCLEGIFLAFAGPERANAFQYIPILCFWMLLDPWDSHGMNETWIIYDYIIIYDNMWCFQCLVFCHSGLRNPLLHATSWRGCLHRTTALHHRSVDLPTLNRKGPWIRQVFGTPNSCGGVRSRRSLLWNNTDWNGMDI